MLNFSKLLHVPDADALSEIDLENKLSVIWVKEDKDKSNTLNLEHRQSSRKHLLKLKGVLVLKATFLWISNIINCCTKAAAALNMLKIIL